MLRCLCWLISNDTKAGRWWPPAGRGGPATRRRRSVNTGEGHYAGRAAGGQGTVSNTWPAGAWPHAWGNLEERAVCNEMRGRRRGLMQPSAAGDGWWRGNKDSGPGTSIKHPVPSHRIINMGINTARTARHQMGLLPRPLSGGQPYLPYHVISPYHTITFHSIPRATRVYPNVGWLVTLPCTPRQLFAHVRHI